VRDVTPLGRELATLIASEGPISVERYMALCLGHPRHGYYMTRDPFGREGDFTTAPEISQMFGELLGLWVAEAWSAMGRPAHFALVELGPGRGTLMADALRALRIVPECRAALSVHLVETSPMLRDVQRTTLSALSADVRLAWNDTFADVPSGPAIVLANEFLDALPVRQFVRTETGWHERMVGLAEDRLAFGLFAEPERSLVLPGRVGDLVEIGEAAQAVTRHIAGRLASDGGAALFIDYGHARSGFGETLQAVRRHAFVDPLAEPGEADLTVHVDFAAVARAAAGTGARVHGPVTQGAFLQALGIQARAAALARNAAPDTKIAIDAALNRLTGAGKGQMGDLFKVLALSHPALTALPALPAALPREAAEDPA
jgi:NADH dehydrogenase [ubiquinone] 1 alpha subcomplex assembly factor 7